MIDNDIKLKKKKIKVEIELFKESWEWFFDTIYNTKDGIKRNDGKSLGNFWTIIHRIDEQYREAVENNK